MNTRLTAAFACVILLCLEATASPTWSPKRGEFAFLTSAGEEEGLFSAGWLFRAEDEGPPRPTGVQCQLWVGSVHSKERWLAAHSEGRLSSPAWDLTGESLLFVEFDPDHDFDPAAEASEGELRLIRARRDGRREILLAQRAAFKTTEIQRLPERRTAVSPSGAFVACPWVGTAGLLVFSLADGRVAASFADGEFPSWAPNGAYLACRKESVPQQIVLHPVGHWTASVRAVEGETIAHPIYWNSAGSAFYYLREGRTVGRHANLVEVMRVSVTDFSARIVHQSEQVRRAEGSPPFVSMAFDPRADLIYLTSRQSGMRMVLDAIDTDSWTSRRTWSPFPWHEDFYLPTVALQASATGDYLAFRIGDTTWQAPIGIFDANQGRTSLQLVNNSARLRALRSFIGAIEALLDMPVPAEGDVPVDSQAREAGARIGAITQPVSFHRFPLTDAHQRLLDRASSPINFLCGKGLEVTAEARIEPHSPALEEQLLECEILFHYARRDLAAAARGIDQLRIRLGTDRIADQMLLATLACQCEALTGRQPLTAWRISRLLEQRRRQFASQTPVEDSLDTSHRGSASQTAETNLEGVDPVIDRLASLLAASLAVD